MVFCILGRGKPGVAGAAITETHDARSLPCKHGSDSRLQGFEHPLERVESNEVRTRGIRPPSISQDDYVLQGKQQVSAMANFYTDHPEIKFNLESSPLM